MGVMPPFIGDKYHITNKLLHIGSDINEINLIKKHFNERFNILKTRKKRSCYRR